MKIAVRLAVLSLLLVPVRAFAQEPQAQPQHPLAGYWGGNMVQGEESEVIVELHVDGDVLSGPIMAKGAGDLYIRDTSMTENSVHFTSPSLDPKGEGSALVWTGQLTAEGQLSVSVVPESGDGQAREFVLTKRGPLPGGGK